MKQSSWLILTHQLPPKPSNVRVKIWRKLQSLGAVPIKNSIYVLPNNPEAREDFEWLRQEIVQMKGDASVFLADALGPGENKEIVQSFQKARERDFATFLEETSKLESRLKDLFKDGPVKTEPVKRLEKEWKRKQEDWTRLVKIDFFHAPNRAKAEASFAAVTTHLERAKSLSTPSDPKDVPPIEAASLKGRLWVTRQSPHVDRLASAWLIRRFIDPKARFKFVMEPYKPLSSREARFDMYQGEFTHFGDWCTFETLTHRLGLKDPALLAVAEIIHDLDLKDGKFSRPETSGVGRLLSGLCALHEDDFERLDAGIAFFDMLYGSLGGTSKTKNKGGVK
jgi:hypothetical protein